MGNPVEQYNEYVLEWNERFSHLCSAMTVEESKFEDSVLQRMKRMFTDETMTERQKISTTVTLVGDYVGPISSVQYTDTEAGKLSRQELAILLVRAGNEVLEAR